MFLSLQKKKKKKLFLHMHNDAGNEKLMFGSDITFKKSLLLQVQIYSREGYLLSSLIFSFKWRMNPIDSSDHSLRYYK